MNNKILPVAIVIAGLLVAGGLIYVNKNCGQKTGVLSAQQASEKAIDFVNANFLQEGTKASLISFSEESDIYKFKLKIGENEYDSYVTRDGKFLFTEPPISLEATTSNGTQGQKTCDDVAKVEKPVLEAFVVSKCPYGVQIQRVLYEIVKNIPSLKENIKVRYIGAIEEGKITAMHGDAEAQENLRQICIREEQSDKYWNYISCHIKAGNVDNCLTSAGINKTALNVCMTDSSKGLAYAQVDFAAQAKYGATGSPTLILNEGRVSEYDFGGRTAEAVKTLICCGYQTEPDSCSTKLTEAQAAVGFSAVYEGTGSSSGGCE